MVGNGYASFLIERMEILEQFFRWHKAQRDCSIKLIPYYVAYVTISLENTFFFATETFCFDNITMELTILSNSIVTVRTCTVCALNMKIFFISYSRAQNYNKKQKKIAYHNKNKIGFVLY